MAQLLGNTNGTGRVAELGNGGNSNVRVYAVYAHDTFQSVVLINANLANASETDKSSITFNLDLPGFRNEVLYLSTLTADGGDSTSGTTWNGLTFSNDNGKPSGDSRSAATTVRIDGTGKASIKVRTPGNGQKKGAGSAAIVQWSRDAVLMAGILGAVGMGATSLLWRWN